MFLTFFFSSVSVFSHFCFCERFSPLFLAARLANIATELSRSPDPSVRRQRLERCADLLVDLDIHAVAAQYYKKTVSAKTGSKDNNITIKDSSTKCS